MTVNAADARVFRSMIIFLGGIFFFAVQPALSAQDSSLEELPGLRERAVVMHIVSRIVEQNQNVVWNSENSRVTIPGRPVGVKLVGDNLVVVVQFTPFLQDSGQNILVAQAQIWINVPDQGMSYHTTMQTIPLQFGEQVYFFPLGSMQAKDENEAKAKDDARIEIQLVVEPYAGPPPGNRQNRLPVEGRQHPGRKSDVSPQDKAGSADDSASGADTTSNTPANADNNGNTADSQ